jgi:hypothetical protein
MQNVFVSLEVIPNGSGKPFGALMADKLLVAQKTKQLEFGMSKPAPVFIPSKDTAVEFGVYPSVQTVKLWRVVAKTKPFGYGK